MTHSIDLESKLIFDNFMSFFSTCFSLNQHQGCSYTLTSAEFPLFNSVVHTEVTEKDLPIHIADIKHVYKNKKQFCWWVTDFVQPTTLGPLLEASDFQKGDIFKGMIYDLNNPIISPKNTEHITVQQISQADQLNEWSKVLQIALDIDDLSQQFLASTYQRLFSDPRFKHFYVKKDNMMVATGSLFIENNISGFYNLGVLPECRNQGIATALKTYRLQLSQSMGLKTAILHSSEMGRKLDQSLGFKPISDFIAYFSC